jgi:ribosomal protein S27AE
VQRNKIDLKKVLSAMNKTCPACGHSITPAEIVRVDFERMICPKCGEIFDARKVRKTD